jgi:hypothetical protein
MTRWRMYHGYCSHTKAEFKLWLRSGCEGLLALTITHFTSFMEFIVSEWWITRRVRTQAVGNLARQLLSCLDCLISGEQLNDVLCSKWLSWMRGNFGLITVQSSHIHELCALYDRASAWQPVIRCTLTRAQFSNYHMSWIGMTCSKSVKMKCTAMHINYTTIMQHLIKHLIQHLHNTYTILSQVDYVPLNVFNP